MPPLSEEQKKKQREYSRRYYADPEKRKIHNEKQRIAARKKSLKNRNLKRVKELIALNNLDTKSDKSTVMVICDDEILFL